MKLAIQRCTESLERNKSNNQVLDATLQALVSHPRSKNLDLAIPTEHLTEKMESSIVDSVRAKIQPLFADLRTELSESMRSRNSDMYTALWPKVAMTLRMIDTIQAQMSAGNIEGLRNALQDSVSESR